MVLLPNISIVFSSVDFLSCTLSSYPCHLQNLYVFLIDELESSILWNRHIICVDEFYFGTRL